MERWFFFPIQNMQKETAQKYSDNAKPRKNNQKRNTDLTKQLHRLITIIPYIESEPFIYNDPGEKFSCCHKDHAANRLAPESISPVNHLPLPCNETEADSSQNKHGPVRKTPEDHFKFIINRTAKRPQKQIFTYFFNCLSPVTQILLFIVDKNLKIMTSQKEPTIHGFQYNKILYMHPVAPTQFSQSTLFLLENVQGYCC